MAKNHVKFIILGLLVCVSVILICKKDTDKIILDEVKLKEPERKNGMFAIMLQSSEGSEDYTQSEDETFPKEGYTLNEEKSGCLDSDGKKIEDVTLIYKDGKISLKTRNTSYCYIYFDKEEPMNLRKACEGQSKLEECIKNNSSKLEKIENLKLPNIGDLKYRYVREDPNNYICFGSGQKCTTEDNYMYRIIGITENGELKLQKYNALPGTMKWHDNYRLNVYWNTSSPSSLFTSLNTGFLNNSTYIPQDDNSWKDLILSRQWKIGDSNADGSYSSTGKDESADKVWKWESATLSNNYKIGLMYVSDYYLAVDGLGNKSCKFSGSCKSWMYHNESEWTMSRYGQDITNRYSAWYVHSEGMVGAWDMDKMYVVRPVFYLTADTKIIDGSGTSDNPYILELSDGQF